MWFKQNMKKMASFLAFILYLSLINISLYAQGNRESTETSFGKIIKEIKIEGLKRTKEHVVTRELISKSRRTSVQRKHWTWICAVNRHSLANIFPPHPKNRRSGQRSRSLAAGNGKLNS